MYMHIHTNTNLHTYKHTRMHAHINVYIYTKSHEHIAEMCRHGLLTIATRSAKVKLVPISSYPHATVKSYKEVALSFSSISYSTLPEKVKRHRAEPTWTRAFGLA